MDPNRVLGVLQELWVNHYQHCDCCTDDEAATHQCKCVCHSIVDLRKDCKKEKENSIIQWQNRELRDMLNRFQMAVKRVLPFLRGYAKGKELDLILEEIDVFFQKKR